MHMIRRFTVDEGELSFLALFTLGELDTVCMPEPLTPEQSAACLSLLEKGILRQPNFGLYQLSVLPAA